MKTKVEELADSKVLLEVEVPEPAVRHAIEHAASDMAETMRVPGFRKGKVPMQVVVARVGKDALSAEAVRSHIDGWFWDAAQTVGLRPVAGPEVEWDELPGRGEAFTFRATVPVAPTPEVPDWSTLEVPAAEPEVPAEVVDAELERVRDSVAELVPVSGRGAQEGDTLVLDLVAREQDAAPSEHRDYVVELGAGYLADELEVVIPGMNEGETKTVELAVPDEPGGEVEVTVKEIKAKLLPELDDDLARSATEFETLAELRGDIETRLRDQLAEELEARFRQDALDALVEKTAIEGVDPLVERRAQALLASLVRGLEQRGIKVETYLTMTGQSPEQVQAATQAEAEQQVKRELVLDAAADKAGIEVSDEEIEELVRAEAAEAGEDADADEMIAAMRERGGFEQLRGDLRAKKALDEIVAGVKRIPVDLAKAREQLWTPEKEKGPTGMKIWTPGSEEAP